MNKDDKELLLKDLCAKLPYGVIGLYTWKCKKSYNKELTGNLYDELCFSWSSTEDSQFLPYLRPLSSMTEEEKIELTLSGCRIKGVGWNGWVQTIETIDWLNAHHFDYRGLIPIGLAIEAPEGMYK